MKKQTLALLSALMCMAPMASYAMGSKPQTSSTPGLTNTQDPVAVNIAVQSIMNQEVIYRLEYRNKALDSSIPNNEMDGLEAAWFGAMVRFISENPAFLGGSWDRGFNPKIWKAMVKVFRERAVPMTSDGILLPPNPNLEIRVVAGEQTASGAMKNVRMFLTDKQGQILGPDLKPLKQSGFETIDGETVPVGDRSGEFARYAGLTEALRNSTVKVASTQASSAAAIGSDDPETRGFGECLGMVADMQWDAARLCFTAAGQSALADAVSLVGDLAVTGARGAVGGAVVGSAFPGIGSSAGAAYGALGNMLAVVYNAFFRREDISPQNVRQLLDFMAIYTFQPTVYGEILPKNGQWAITRAGYVRRVTDMSGKLVLLDVLGNPVTREQSYTLSREGTSPVPSLASGGTAAPVATPGAGPAPAPTVAPAPAPAAPRAVIGAMGRL